MSVRLTDKQKESNIVQEMRKSVRLDERENREKDWKSENGGRVSGDVQDS